MRPWQSRMHTNPRGHEGLNVQANSFVDFVAKLAKSFLVWLRLVPLGYDFLCLRSDEVVLAHGRGIGFTRSCSHSLALLEHRH